RPVSFCARAVPAFFPLDGAAVRSSTRVFHWRQPGHCPIHLADSYPHSLQKKTVFVFDFAIKLTLHFTFYPKYKERIPARNILPQQDSFPLSFHLKTERRHHDKSVTLII